MRAIAPDKLDMPASPRLAPASIAEATSLASLQRIAKRAEHEEFTRFGVVGEERLGSRPAGVAGCHQPFEIGFETLVDAADIGFVENWTVDLPTAAQPKERRVLGMLVHDGRNSRDAVHRLRLS